MVPISTPPSTVTHPGDFLKSQNRRAHNVLPDGNCMFRSLSHQLYGSDEYHIQLRHALLEQIQNNYKTYQPYWIEADQLGGKVLFDEHLESLAKTGSWGTQVELQATSDRFNVEVFVCSPNPSRIIRWGKEAVPRHHSTIIISSLTMMPSLPFTFNHLELFYSNSHYQSVVPAEEGTRLQSPVIIARSSDHGVIE